MSLSSVVAVLFFSCFLLPLVHSTGYATYHLYQSGDSLTTVACSDGANGLMTKFRYSSLSPFYPYVMAWNEPSWNSPKCGSCIRLSSGGRTIHVTVIDQCGPPPGGYDAHFDISLPAFTELFGSGGVNQGHGTPEWQVVSSNNCKGQGGSGGVTTSPSGTSNPTPSGTSNPTPSGGGKGDWEFCSSSSECNNKCCSKQWSNDGRFKCTPGGNQCSGSQTTSPVPVPVPVPAPTGGSFNCGGRTCSSGCCSEWGYCGTSAAYCGSGCRGGSCWGSNAAEGSEINEDTNTDADDENAGDTTTNNNDGKQDGVPGWGVALLVLGCLIVVSVIALLVVTKLKGFF